jgi:polyphosphate kinase 2 (PPK2 family)
LKRLENAGKHWKFSPSDLMERGFRDEYTSAFEDAFTATSAD